MHKVIKKTIAKLHKSSSSVAFFKKALHNNITPTFAKIKGQFSNTNTKSNAEKDLMRGHINKHYNDIRLLRLDYCELKKQLQLLVGNTFTSILLKSIEKSLHKERLESFRTKNKKIANLIKNQKDDTFTNYSVPIINLSNYTLNDSEYNQLKFGLNHCFINKDKHIKKNIVANMESLAHSASKQVDPSQLENFHEFLRGYTDIFSKNVLSTNDETYKNLKNLIRKSDIVILRGDKDSSVVIMNRSDYIEKLEGMIEGGVKKGTYKKTEDTTLQDLKKFQDFLYRNFYTYEHYKSMYPHSNQPAKLYGTAKTHKFNNIQEINKERLKFRPIIDQTGTYSYNTAQVISQYLKPLCKNEVKINETQSFAVDIKNIQPLQEDEEDVSYDVESLFTNIPINETIDYILDQIYNKKKLKPICSKLIFKRLLLKLATEVTFTTNNNFFKQTDGCTMGGPLSVTFSDIFMIKMENDIVIPMKPIFYRRYVDDIYSRRKKNIEDSLFKALNSYHKNIKLTIEINPIKFLDTHLHNKDGTFVTKVYRKETKIPAHGSSQIPKRYKRNSIKVDLHRTKNISTNFEEELKLIRNKFIKADFPVPFINIVIKDFKNQQTNVQQNNEEELIIPSYFFEV